MTNIREAACYWTADLCIMKTRKFNLVVHVMKNRSVARFSGRAISRCHAEQSEASGHSMIGQVCLRETLLICRPDPSLTLRMTKGTLRMTNERPVNSVRCPKNIMDSRL